MAVLPDVFPSIAPNRAGVESAPPLPRVSRRGRGGFCESFSLRTLDGLVKNDSQLQQGAAGREFGWRGRVSQGARGGGPPRLHGPGGRCERGRGGARGGGGKGDPPRP